VEVPPRVIGLTVAFVVLGLAAVGGASTVDVPPSTVATVERIIDGDTLVVRGGARVRLVQIDAPEAGGAGYPIGSTMELVRLAGPGTRVGLESDPALDRVDRFGRLLRYVHARGRNVNVELVRRGAATPWFYGGDRGRYATSLLGATTSARDARRGMWGACRVSWSPYDPVSTRSR